LKDSKTLSQVRKPHRPTKTGLILRPVVHDCEALLFEQLAVFSSIQARMIKRLPFQPPDDLPVRWSGSKHKCRPWCGMIPKDWKHFPLIAVVQMKETVPRKDAVKSLRKGRGSAYPPPPHAVRANGLETFVPSQVKNRFPSPQSRIGVGIARSVLPPRSHSREPILRTEEVHRSDPAKAFHRECSPVSVLGPMHQRGARREGRRFRIRCSSAKHKANIDPARSAYRKRSTSA